MDSVSRLWSQFKERAPWAHRALCFVPALPPKTRGKLWLILGPLLASTMLLMDFEGNSKARKTAFATFWIAFYWMTEALPIAATALLPVLLMPMLSILTAKEISGVYMNDTLFLMLGSFIFAAAMERWNLHKKIALSFLLLIGERPRLLMLGFMLTTAFISMFISNTATTSMMTPLALAVLSQLKDRQSGLGAESDSSELESSSSEIPMSPPMSPSRQSLTAHHDDEMSLNLDENDNHIQLSSNPSSSSRAIEESVQKFCCGTLLGVAYSASIGGTATLIGTGPNIVFSSFLRSFFPKYSGVSFVHWSLFAIPLALIMIFVTWIIVIWLYGRNAHIKVHRETLEAQNRALGAFNFPQRLLLATMVIMVVLWASRKWIDDTGVFGHGFITDGTVSMFIGISLFFIPHLQDESHTPSTKEKEHADRIIDSDLLRILPWDIIVLMGGGMALADAFTKSGLSAYVTARMHGLASFPGYFMLILVCTVVLFVTELTSNVATITLVLPIMASMAVSLGQNPLLLMIPTTICSSFAFMLPVATPPNAIVFASHQVKVSDMARTGILLNLLSVVLIPTLMYTLGRPIFGIELGVVPDWALPNAPVASLPPH